MKTRNALFWCSFLLVFYCSPVPAPANQAAGAVADRFLAGLESVDPAERDSMLADSRWSAPSFEYPGFVSAVKLYEGFFGTDVEGLVGYERLILLTVYLRPEVRLDKVYRLVAYPDRLTGRWKVWAFREWNGLEGTPLRWQEKPIFDRQREEMERLSFVYQLSLTGRLMHSLAVCERLAESESGNPLPGTLEAQINATLRDLRRIVGK